MTLQKLYEKLVRHTLISARTDELSPFYNVANTFEFNDLYNWSFPEICIKANLAGIALPGKAAFKSWGERYLVQSLYFIGMQLNDDSFLNEFLTTITQYKTTKQLISDEFKNTCYDIYYEHVMNNHEICRCLSEFIVNNCQTSKFYNNFWTLANGTGLISHSISYLDFIKTKR